MSSKLTRLERFQAFTDVIVTEGEIIDGTKIAGVFASEDDARSGNADALALGTVAWETLTVDEQSIAVANSALLVG